MFLRVKFSPAKCVVHVTVHQTRSFSCRQPNVLGDPNCAVDEFDVLSLWMGNCDGKDDLGVAKAPGAEQVVHGGVVHGRKEVAEVWRNVLDIQSKHDLQKLSSSAKFSAKNHVFSSNKSCTYVVIWPEF